ncbi:MAG: hypothetical protein Q9186_002196 [Xanthomendoza sp. 1 TL-2023]
MSRARVVLNLLAARQAARQSGEHVWAPSQPSSRIRNRPALHTSSLSTSTGRSQPVKVQSRPSLRQRLPLAAPATSTSEASSVLDRLQARRERLAAARSSSDKASKPGKLETWATIRQRHATPNVGASHGKPAHPRQPLSAYRARQTQPVAEKPNVPSRQSSSEPSVMTGESFSSIDIESLLMVAKAILPPRPLTPQAPRAVRHHDVNCKPVPFAIPSKSSKVPLRGILKRDGRDRSTAGMGITWARQLTRVRIVDRWIGVAQPVDSPAVVSNKFDHVHPDPARLTGRIRSWPGSNGRDYYLTGNDRWGAQHAECQSPDCNKRRLHRWQGRLSWLHCLEKDVGVPGPGEEDFRMFNARRGFTPHEYPRTGDRLLKDVGLEDWKLR